ncbi:MAG: hypothetical protein V8S89_01930 [Oscillospiraceae bacterium]
MKEILQKPRCCCADVSAVSSGRNGKISIMYYNMVFAKNVLKPSAAGENNRFFKGKRF